MKFRLARSALVVLPALLLAACGGGGGGGEGGNDSSTSTPTYTSDLTITSANAKPVAADGLDASVNTGGVQAGASVLTGVQVDVSGTPVTVPTLSDVALKLVDVAAGKMPAMATGVAVSDSAPCSNAGGSISITGDVSGTGNLVAGDTLTITATNCAAAVSGQATTLNGQLTIKVEAGTFNVQSAVYPKQITMSVVARSLSASTLGLTDTTDGDMKIELQQLSPTAANSTLSGSSLTNTWSNGSATRSVALKNYRFTQDTNGTQVRSDVTATVVSTNSRVGSNVVYTVTTPSPIVKDLGVIASGSLKVTGASSGLLLTVTSPNNFTLQVDANGDGTYESSSTTTLAELQGLL